MLWRVQFFPFTIIFALLYGLLIDGTSLMLKARGAEGEVSTPRLVAAVTVSTTITGLGSYYTTTNAL